MAAVINPLSATDGAGDPVMPDALLWNLDEAARQLGGISTKTVRRLAQQGAFPLVKIN